MLQTAAAALSSLATLSLSGSPPPPSVPQTNGSFTPANGQVSNDNATKVPKQEATDEDIVPDEPSTALPAKTEINGAGISVTKTGKKRGTIFKCESCSKVGVQRFSSSLTWHTCSETCMQVHIRTCSAVFWKAEELLRALAFDRAADI